MLTWCKKMFGSKPDDMDVAYDRVHTAIENIDAELVPLRETLRYTQQQLQHMMKSGAPDRCKAVSLVNKIKHIETQLREKERVRNNILREKQQLDDSNTNAMVSSALVQSHAAQTKLQAKGLASIELDDLLDDVEDNRVDTRELTTRLGGLGGMDDDELHIDEASISASDITMAMGLRTEKDRVLDEAERAMGDPLMGEVQDILRSMEITPGAPYTAHGEYSLPSAPGSQASVASKHSLYG
jgi:23S rRNA pseudoU1915 N3-methylase RlmH